MKLYIVLLFAIFHSCMSGKISTKTGIDEIHFGSGGGFTGEVKAYMLSANGQLTERTKEIGLSKEIDSKTILGIFSEAKEIKAYSLNEPGNIYLFIEIKSKETSNKIVWAYGSTIADNKVIQLYNKLISLTR